MVEKDFFWIFWKMKNFRMSSRENGFISFVGYGETRKNVPYLTIFQPPCTFSSIYGTIMIHPWLKRIFSEFSEKWKIITFFHAKTGLFHLWVFTKFQKIEKSSQKRSLDVGLKCYLSTCFLCCFWTKFEIFFFVHMSSSFAFEFFFFKFLLLCS